LAEQNDPWVVNFSYSITIDKLYVIFECSSKYVIAQNLFRYVLYSRLY
jgi:hypothetical protein